VSDPGPLPGHGVIINGPGPHDWLDRYEVVALVTLAALPVAAVATWQLVRRRRVAGDTTSSAWRTSLAEVGILYGTLPWLWLTLMPAGTGPAAHGTVSLVPLRDLATMPTYQVVGNLLVLGALGFFAPLRFAVLASMPRVLALAATCSILVESAQYVLQLGRVSSVDDVLLNTIGAGLAALASRSWWAHPARRGSVPGRRSVDALAPGARTPGS
jgi:VanZ family protein